MNPTFRQMETSAREVHENMNAVIDYQTHHRLRETQVGLFSIGHDRQQYEEVFADACFLLPKVFPRDKVNI